MHYGNCNAEPTIIRRVLRDNLENNCHCNLDDKTENTKKAVINVLFKNVFPKSKQNPWKVLNLKVIGLQFCQAGPPNMNCFKGFAETISFLFYIFKIYVQLFLRNKLLQILLI